MGNEPDIPDSIIRLLTAITEEPSLNLTITISQAETIGRYLSYAYALGFDDGKGRQSHRKRVAKVLDGKVIKVYESIEMAAKCNDAIASNISKVILGKKKKHRGFEWKLATT